MFGKVYENSPGTGVVTHVKKTLEQRQIEFVPNREQHTPNSSLVCDEECVKIRGRYVSPSIICSLRLHGTIN